MGNALAHNWSKMRSCDVLERAVSVLPIGLSSSFRHYYIWDPNGTNNGVPAEGWPKLMRQKPSHWIITSKLISITKWPLSLKVISWRFKTRVEVFVNLMIWCVRHLGMLFRYLNFKLQSLNFLKVEFDIHWKFFFTDLIRLLLINIQWWIWDPIFPGIIVSDFFSKLFEIFLSFSSCKE